MTKQAFITQLKASSIYRHSMAPFHRFMAKENVLGWVWSRRKHFSRIIWWHTHSSFVMVSWACQGNALIKSNFTYIALSIHKIQRKVFSMLKLLKTNTCVHTTHMNLHTHTAMHTCQCLKIFVFSIVWILHFICFQHVANMMMRMKREFAGTQNQILPVFDSLLLLDRNVDLLTPLATQLTYEGLIDEIYGITNGLNKTLINICFEGFFFFFLF